LRLRARTPAGEREPQDRAVHRAELLAQRAGVVRQLVAPADVAHARCDLGVAVGRHVREQVVLDLKAEIAAEQVKQRSAVDVGGAEALAYVPAAARLLRYLLLAERVGLVGEVPAEEERGRRHG